MRQNEAHRINVYKLTRSLPMWLPLARISTSIPVKASRCCEYSIEVTMFLQRTSLSESSKTKSDNRQSQQQLRVSCDNSRMASAKNLATVARKRGELTGFNHSEISRIRTKMAKRIITTEKAMKMS